MKPNSPRDLIAVGIITLAGVVGAATLINDRLESGLQQRRVQLAALSAESRFSPDASRAHNLAREAEHLLNWLRGDGVGDQEPLYARLMELGEVSGVRIDRIDPGAEDTTDNGFVQTVSFAIEAAGEFEQIVRLLASIESMEGFHIITRFALAPVAHASGERVQASIQTMHYQFDPAALPAQMASMEEGDE